MELAIQNHTHDKKYILEEIKEFGKQHNVIYDDIEGKVCFLAYLKVGERGWFLYESDGLESWFLAAHRIHTSIVKKLVYTEDKVFVETENTRFVFKMINW